MRPLPINYAFKEGQRYLADVPNGKVNAISIERRTAASAQILTYPDRIKEKARVRQVKDFEYISIHGVRISATWALDD